MNLEFLDLDPAKIAPQTEFQPLPEGEYVVTIIDSEVKQTKNGTGYYLQLRLQVVDGPYRNRTIFDRINIANQNKTAEDIGQQALGALCYAAGFKERPKDSAELHNIPIIARIRVRHDPNYGDGNEVRGYKSASASASAHSASATAQPQAPAAPRAPKAPSAAARAMEKFEATQQAAADADPQMPPPGAQQAAANGATDRRPPWLKG